MADFNDESNGVFGGVNFNETNMNPTNENTSYFENGAQGKVPEDNNNDMSGIFANFATDSNAGAYNGTVENGTEFRPIQREKAITKQGLWSRVKAFLFQDIDLTAPIKVELTPAQQKVEDEINDFLHQEVSFKGIANFFSIKK